MWLAALIMGLAGSLHCAGMCSPLAMTITGMKGSAISNRILYNTGRITIYGLLGGVVASIGYILPISKYQNLLSLLLALALLTMAVVGITDVRIPFLSKAMIKFTNFLKNQFGKFLHRKGSLALLCLGGLNGLLPCGLTFVALSFCITLTTPVEGFFYMFLFGVGTLPVMLGFASIAGFVTRKLKWDLKNVTTALMAISGILLIVRVFLLHAPEGHEAHNLVDIIICR